MKAKTAVITERYTSVQGGAKTIPVYTPPSGKKYIGGVTVVLRKTVSEDVVNSLQLVIVNETSGTYKLLRRLSADDFENSEQRDMLSSDGSRYRIGSMVLSSSDRVEVLADVAPVNEVALDIRLSGFEDNDV